MIYKPYSFFLKEKRKQINFTNEHMNIYLSSPGAKRANAALDNRETWWTVGMIVWIINTPGTRVFPGSFFTYSF